LVDITQINMERNKKNFAKKQKAGY